MEKWVLWGWASAFWVQFHSESSFAFLRLIKEVSIRYRESICSLSLPLLNLDLVFRKPLLVLSLLLFMLKKQQNLVLPFNPRSNPLETVICDQRLKDIPARSMLLSQNILEHIVSSHSTVTRFRKWNLRGNLAAIFCSLIWYKGFAMAYCCYCCLLLLLFCDFPAILLIIDRPVMFLNLGSRFFS